MRFARTLLFLAALLALLYSSSLWAGWAIFTASASLGGWTVFTASSGTGSCSASTKASTATCIYYVSTSGNDSNNCAGDPPINNSFATPCLTIAHGISLLRSGSPDWLLLKKGDTFTNQSFGDLTKKGLNATATADGYSGLMLLSSYPTTAGARPLVQTNASTSDSCYSISGGGGTHGDDGSYVALVGIECYDYKHDPGNGSYNPALASAAGLNILGTGIAGVPGLQFFLMEDCKLSFYANNNVQGDDTTPGGNDHIETVILNRNVFAFNYSTTGQATHSQGLYIQSVHFPTVKENLFDHNGWNATVGDPTDQFKHNLYLNNDVPLANSPSIVTGNITARASSHGYQGRHGGTITNNLVIGNTIAGYVDYQPNSIQDHNVVLNGEDHTIGTGAVGNGLAVTAVAANPTGTTMNFNIVTHVTASNGSTFGLDLDTGTTGITASNNIVCGWTTNELVDSGSGNTKTGNTLQTTCAGIGPDPTNATIEAYSTFLNTACTANGYGATSIGTMANFLCLASLNSKDNWNPAYMAGAAENFIRQKLGMAAYPFLLKRDLNPANDNTPMWLNKIA